MCLTQHCSCVRTIQEALSSLDPPPKAIDASIITHTVTVRHAVSISPDTIKAALDDVGFDIVSTPLNADPPPSFVDNVIKPIFGSKREKHLEKCSQCQAEHTQSLAHSKPEATAHVAAMQAGPAQVVLSIGGMTCASCSNTITDALRELPGVSDVAVNLLGNSATVNIDKTQFPETLVETIEDVGYEAEVVRIEPLLYPDGQESKLEENSTGILRLTLSIGGMTCASCVNTVTRTMLGVSGLSDPAVNLLGNSATAFVADEKVAAQTVEAIEDAGYDAQMVSLERVATRAEDERASTLRTVALQIHGMSCQ